MTEFHEENIRIAVHTREKLFNRLYNWKFHQAIQYIPGSNIEKVDEDLIVYLARQFGNCGCMDGDFGTLIDAALRSISGYAEYQRSLLIADRANR